MRMPCFTTALFCSTISSRGSTPCPTTTYFTSFVGILIIHIDSVVLSDNYSVMFLEFTDTDEAPLVRLSAVLVAAAPNGSVLVVEQDGRWWLPSRTVRDGESTSQVAAKLLLELTGVGARTGAGTSGWVDLFPAGIHDHPDNRAGDTRTVYVLYGTILPEKAKVTSGAQWTPLWELCSAAPEMAVAASEVLRKC